MLDIMKEDRGFVVNLMDGLIKRWNTKNVNP